MLSSFDCGKVLLVRMCSRRFPRSDCLEVIRTQCSYRYTDYLKGIRVLKCLRFRDLTVYKILRVLICVVYVLRALTVFPTFYEL